MNAIAASVGRIHLRSTTREWLVFAAFFLLFGSYQVYFFHNRHVRVDQRERDRLSDQCSMVSTNMARQFSSINAVLAGLVKEVPAWRAQSGGYTLAAQHLMALNNAMPGVLTFLVFDANGTVLASDKPELVGQNFAERDYFQAVQKNPNPDTLYVRPPFTSKLGNFTMNLVRMVPDSSGQFDGMVVAGLDAEEFRVLLHSVLYRPDTRASLVHGDGVPFLMAPNSKYIGGVNLVQPGSFFARHLQTEREANVFTGQLAFDGDERLIAMRTIHPKALAMDKPMVVAVDRPLRAIFASWERDAQHAASMFGALTLAAGLGLWWRQRSAKGPQRASAATHARSAAHT